MASPVVFLPRADDRSRLPSVELDEETIERLDTLRVEDESDDELIDKPTNIDETSEYALFHTASCPDFPARPQAESRSHRN